MKLNSQDYIFHLSRQREDKNSDSINLKAFESAGARQLGENPGGDSTQSYLI
jgi:hypothetical protein